MYKYPTRDLRQVLVKALNDRRSIPTDLAFYAIVMHNVDVTESVEAAAKASGIPKDKVVLWTETKRKWVEDRIPKIGEQRLPRRGRIHGK